MIVLRSLGPLEARAGDGPAPPELLWRKNLALLVYLARSPRRTRTREHLTGLLWGDRPEQAARHSLREAIRVLRQCVGDDAVRAEGDRIELVEGAVALDADALERHAAGGDWEAAAGVATGEFLEGFSVPDASVFDDWLAAERGALRRIAVEALVRTSEERQRSGDPAAGLGLARRALQLDPASDAAVRAAMRAHALLGERAAALAAFDTFSAQLHALVGAEPDETTKRLAGQVRHQRAGPAPRKGETGAVSRRAPLVGRGAELARLLQWWDTCRAGRATVTVVEGDAGSGRTRLLEEMAARARLDGAAVAALRATSADRDEAWSGTFALAGGGLLDAPGIAAASPEALATFAARLDAWADRFPAARREAPLGPAAALSAVVRAAAGEQPVVLIADDAHWLDGDSLAALHALARDAATLPVMIAVSLTPQPPREELDELRARLGRDLAGGAVSVGPLGPDALHALARWAMPSYDDVETDRLARRVAADSAGWPLIAVELLHAVALGLDLHGTPRAWPEPKRTLDQTLPGDLPDSLVTAIRIGFRRLTRQAQTVVAAAAALDEPVAVARLKRATGLSDEVISSALDEAEWQRWLAADSRGYGFVARLARVIVARDLLTEGQRRRIVES